MKKLLRNPEAASYMRVAPQTLAKMRCDGSSPPYIKVGRLVLYDVAEIDRWLDQRCRRSTSDPGLVAPPGV
jgi:predicted DNA-binding transcriptional regulator AlpA